MSLSAVTSPWQLSIVYPATEIGRREICLMAHDLDYLEGKKFCVVFVRVVDEKSGRVQLQCFRGRANVERGRLKVINEKGIVFPVPSSAFGNVLPNDGTKMLLDAEYFVLVKTDENIDFTSVN